MTLLSQPLREGETKILDALKDGKPKKFTELKRTTRLSRPSLSENLKRLQNRKQNMVKRDIDSRKYVIGPEGLCWLRRDDLADTIKSGSLSEERLTSPPINSIVAVDVPEMPESQQQAYAAGTPDIAKACFKQFLVDTLKAKGPGTQAGDPRGLLPTTGRIVYTAFVDLGQVMPWLDSAEGKEYLKKTLEEVKEAPQ